MRYIFFILTIVASLSLYSCEQENSIEEIKSNDTYVTFSAQSYEFNNMSWPYCKAEINLSHSNPPVIILYLHGGSARGNDNEKQMQEPAINDIAQYIQTKGMSAIFIVPQCPKTDIHGKPMTWIKMSNAIEYLLQMYRFSESALTYLFGGSMGGTGVYNMLSMYPEIFTAAMVCAGNPKDCKAENIAKTPIYAVMGSEDKIMKPEEINLQSFLDEIISFGGEYKFDTEPGWNHEKVCKDSYTVTRLDWVFSHR